MKELRGRLIFYDKKAYKDNIFWSLVESPIQINLLGKTMSGKAFLDSVQKGKIKNGEGKIIGVYINDFSTNLGLDYNSFKDGEIPLNEKEWLTLCQDYEVIVEWMPKERK